VGGTIATGSANNRPAIFSGTARQFHRMASKTCRFKMVVRPKNGTQPIDGAPGTAAPGIDMRHHIHRSAKPHDATLYLPNMLC
jgi:hypothetical protein